MFPHPLRFVTFTFVFTFLKSASRLFFQLRRIRFFLCHETPAMFSFSRMITSVSAALALASVSSVLAVPIAKQAAPLVSRATIPSPAFVIYTDRFVSADVLPPVAELAVRAFSTL